MLEIVVAAYKEDLNWLEDFSEFKTTVYSKGPTNKGVQLPNIGREAHTFIYHIHNNYENLNDTCFLQGNPFDHCTGLKHATLNYKDFTPLGEILKCDSLGYPHHYLPSIRETMKELELPLKDELTFIKGAQFIAKKEVLLKYPKSFYAKALDIVVKEELMPYVFERFWYIMYNHDL